MNKAIFVGRLTADPAEINASGSTKGATFTLAVDRDPERGSDGKIKRDDQGRVIRKADFPRIVCWARLAETVLKHLNKGRLVAVECSYRSRTVDGPDGKKQYFNDFHADSIKFLDFKSNSKASDEEATSTSDASTADGPPEDF